MFNNYIFKLAWYCRCQYEAIQRSHLKRHMETHNVVKRFVCHHCDYSCNTLGFMKIHYTRHHKDANYTYNPAVTKPSSGNARVYRCLSCDYLFGNLSDMKRHLKVRHHLQVEEICMLDDGQGNQTAQIVTSDIDPANSLELQVGFRMYCLVIVHLMYQIIGRFIEKLWNDLLESC